MAFSLVKNLYFSLIVAIAFVCYSCNTNSSKAKLVKAGIEKLVESFKGNVNCSLNHIDINPDQNILIEVEFNEPYNIVDSEHQDVFISYLVYKVKELHDFEKITFHYFLDREKGIEEREAKYNKAKILKLLNGYNNEVLLNMMEYSFKNFIQTDPYALNASIEYLNRQVPDFTYKLPFFELLVMFSKECSEMDASNRATNTVVLMYAFERDLPGDGIRKRIPPLMKGLWNICGKEDLKTAESDLLRKMNSSE